MDDHPWFSYCDGNIQEVGAIEQLEYHASLNAVIAVDKSSLRIFDANSGITLQESIKGLESNKQLQCIYHNASGSIAITDGNNVGYRVCYSNGLVLLSTALQAPINFPSDVVTLELPISEARLLMNYSQDFLSQTQLNNGKANSVEELLNILINQISNTEVSDNISLSGKWTTVKISLTYSTLKSACHTLLDPHQKYIQSLEAGPMIPGYSSSSLHAGYGVPVVSSILHQLVLLFPSDNPGCIGPIIRSPSRELMYSELTRRATFSEWPHSNYKYALPNAMAQAGFFHQPVATGDDRAMCFACNVCLVCWEPSDEPWSEHERHSPTCPFVCCEPTVNVPISVTHATMPAQPNPFTRSKGSEVVTPIDFLHLGQSSGLLAAASKDGKLAVWDVNDMPELFNILSISPSVILQELNPYLKKISDSVERAPGSFAITEMNITCLHVLDKSPVTVTAPSIDPETGGPSKSSKSDDTPSENKTSDHLPDPFHKTPTLVTGVSVTVSETFRGSEEIPGVTAMISHSPQPTEKKVSLENQDTATEDAPALDDSGVINMCNYDVVVDKVTKVQEDATSSEIPLLESPNTSSVTHEFSLLLFIQPQKNNETKKSSTAAGKKSVSMSKMTLSSMDIDDYAYSHGGGTVPIVDAMSQLQGNIHPIPGGIDTTEMHIEEEFKNMYDFIHSHQEDHIKSMEGKQEFDDDEIYLPKPSFVPKKPIYNEGGDPTPTPEENISVQEGGENPEAESDKFAPVGILQCVMLDQKSVEVSSPAEESTAESSSLQVINNILSTEDGSKLIVSTCPKRRDVGMDSPAANQKPTEETVRHPVVENEEDSEGNSSSSVQPTLENENEKIEESVPKEEDDEDDASEKQKENLFLPLEVDKCSEDQSKCGRLYCFDLEPKHAINFVKSNDPSTDDRGVKWVKSYPMRKISNLPPDFVRSTYEDDEMDSMDGEDEEEQMKENKQEEKVGKSGRNSANEPVTGSQVSYILSLTDNGDITVINATTLEDIYIIKPAEIFSVTPTDTPENPAPRDSETEVQEKSETGSESDVKTRAVHSFVDKREKFMAYVYCTGTERLCVSTDSGKLAFVKIGKHLPVSAKDPEKLAFKAETSVHSISDAGQDQVDGGAPQGGKIHPSSPALLVNQPLTTETLQGLIQLTKFEPLHPRFTATAPVCWTEVPFDQGLGPVDQGAGSSQQQQDMGRQKPGGQPSNQQQPYRRHLHHPNQHYPPDAEFHTRAWRLQPDCTSWSEHLFELVFPRQTNISHIDLKFVLSGKLKEETDIQVSLLKHPGLTTSKNEIKKNEQRRKWRHHGKDEKHWMPSALERHFVRVQHLLTHNFVERVLNETENRINPFLLVQKKTSSPKGYVLMDGTRKKIIAIIPHSPNLNVGNLVMLMGYTSCRIGANTNNVRLVVTCLKVGRERQLSTDSLSAAVPKTGFYVPEWSAAEQSEPSSSWPSENIFESVDLDGDNTDSRAPPPYFLPEEPPTAPLIDRSVSEESEDTISQDGSSILFGPVNLSDYTDAGGIGGLVTVGSKKLLKDSRHRALLVHIKDASGMNPRTGKITSQWKETMSREEWLKKGCNMLQEISITVNRIQRSNISHERTQRVELLHANSLHRELLSGLCSDQREDGKFLAKSLPERVAALDILNWVAGMQVLDPSESGADGGEYEGLKGEKGERENDPHRCSCSLASFMLHHNEVGCRLKVSGNDKVGGAGRTGKNDCKFSLERFLRSSFLEQGRDVAIRALRLLFNTVLHGNTNAANVLGFHGPHKMQIISEALIPCLEAAVKKRVESAYGLYCLFQLMNVVFVSWREEVKGQESKFTKLLERCIASLATAASGMRKNIHPLHAMMRSKFGLYGTPFDPERFTIDKVSSSAVITKVPVESPSAAAEAAAKQQAWEKYFSTEELDIHDLITPKILDVRRGLSVTDLIDGLSLSRFGHLDCQPLHFVCVDASEGCTAGVQLNPATSTEPTSSHTGAPPPPTWPYGLPPGDSSYQKVSKIKNDIEMIFDCYESQMLMSMDEEPDEANLTNVEKIAKKVQDLAPKRHFPQSMGETSDASHMQEDPRSSERPLPMKMTIPNLTFNRPPANILNVSRMHSGARRHVVLDLGQITEVTDIHIPSCPDLSSLVLDAWSEGTKTGPLNRSVFTHIGVTLDICDHDLILGDLTPPVVCRYIRITVIGRYGTTNAQSQFRLGHFYGRPACVGYRRQPTTFDPNNPVPSPPKKSMKEQEEENRNVTDERPVVVGLMDICVSPSGRLAVQRHLAYLRSCQDDIECRYSLACNQLHAFLSQASLVQGVGFAGAKDFLAHNNEEVSGIFGLQGKMSSSRKATLEKLSSAYYKCIGLQIQLNRVTHAVRYMESVMGESEDPSHPKINPFNMTDTKPPCFTQLQTFCELMLNMLLIIPNLSYFTPSLLAPGPILTPSTLINPTLCKSLFENLCSLGNPRIRVRTVCLLLSYSSGYPWWGEFISNTLVQTLGLTGSSSSWDHLPQEQTFSILLALGQRSLVVPQKAESLISSLLHLVEKLLSPLKQQMSGTQIHGSLDLNLLTWVILYITHLTETVLVQNEHFATDTMAPGDIAATHATTSNEASATVKNIGQGFKVSYKDIPKPPQGEIHGISISTARLLTSHYKSSNSMKPSSSTTESRFKSRWSFISVSGEEGAKASIVKSEYLKILNSMKNVLQKLKYHKSCLIKIFEERKEFLKSVEEKNVPENEDGTSQKILSKYDVMTKLKEMRDRAGEHIRNIVGFRRTLDRKSLTHQLNRVKPAGGAKVVESGEDTPDCHPAFVGVSMEACRAVVRGLLRLLLLLDFTTPSDFVVLACKLCGHLCRWCSAQSIFHTNLSNVQEGGSAGSRQPLYLSELMEQEDLKRFLILAVGGTQAPRKMRKCTPGPTVGHPAGPWVSHALQSLLQDILESENNAITNCGDLQLMKDKVESDDVTVDDVTQVKESQNKDEKKSLEVGESDKAGTDSDSDEQDDLDMADISSNDEFTKRITLVNTYISTASDLINDIKTYMRAHGEAVDDDEKSEEKTENSSKSTNSEKVKESFFENDNNWFKEVQAFISGSANMKPAGPPGGPKSYVQVHLTNPSSLHTIAGSKWGPKYACSPLHLHPVAEHQIKKIQAAVNQKIDGGRPSVRKVNPSGASRQLLCSHAFDNRVTHGINRHTLLQRKLCVMAYLKLISRSVTHPPTTVFKDTDEIMKEESPVTEAPTPRDPLSSFNLLRSCLLDLLKESSSYSIPLIALLEMLQLLQNTYNETLGNNNPKKLQAPSLTLLSLDGTKALLTAVNSDHGKCFHDNPQIWSLTINMLNTLLPPRFTIVLSKKFFECFDALICPELSQFLVNLLSSKMAATNTGTVNFNQAVSLLGPSVSSKLTNFLQDFKSLIYVFIFKHKIDISGPDNLLFRFRDLLLRTMAEVAKNGKLDHTSATPTDAQLAFVEFLYDLFTDKVYSNEIRVFNCKCDVAMTIIGHVTKVAHCYLKWSETAIKGKSDQGVDPRSCMSGLFKNLLSSTSSTLTMRTLHSPRDALMLNLLKLCGELVHILQVEEEKSEVKVHAGWSPEGIMEEDHPSPQEETMEVDEEVPLSMDTATDVKDSPEGPYTKLTTVAESVLQNDEIMHSLLSSLVLCSSSAIASIFSGLHMTPTLAIEKSPVSTGDGIFILLSSLVLRTTDPSLPVKSVLKFLSSGQVTEEGRFSPLETSSTPTCQLSYPLLWFIMHVLEDQPNLNEFCELGGAHLIAYSLVSCARETIDQSPNRTSQVLQFMTAAADRAAAFAPKPPVLLQSDMAWPALVGQGGKQVQKMSGVVGQGYNYPSIANATQVGVPGVKVLTPWKENKNFDFASVASIECSDLSAIGADSLLKPKAIHRRSRSPSWSYHFPGESQWVSLTLHFPTAFVLKDVQLIPMLMSLQTTPSCVVLETNRTGTPCSSSYHPVSVPMATSGHSEITIHPPTDEVVTSIRIHMRKPVDSASVGLTRIIVHGVPTFMNYDHTGSHTQRFNNPLESLNLPMDLSRRSTMNWLKLLHHCMFTKDDVIRPQFYDIILEVPGLIPTLCTLLHLSRFGMYMTTIEAVLLQTGVPEKVTQLINCLLRGSSSMSSTHFLDGTSSVASDSSVNILFKLGQTKDENLEKRIQEMLNWVQECAQIANGSCPAFLSLHPGQGGQTSHIHAIACALWAGADSQACRNCLDLPLLRVVYDWSQSLIQSAPTVNFSSPLKSALDWLMCSFCRVDTKCYLALLDLMGFKIDENGDISEVQTIALTPGKLSTLAAVSQSPACLLILQTKGIVKMLSNGLVSFCQKVLDMYRGVTSTAATVPLIPVTPENAVAIINFFSELCSLRGIQEWLGSEEGKGTWVSLLTLYHVLPLTHAASATSRLPRFLLMDLQDATIVLIKRFTVCHCSNQRLFTSTLCDIVSSQTDSKDILGHLTGFVRSLLLRVVLEDEQFVVHLVAGTGQKFFKGRSSSCVIGNAPLRHPMYGTGHLTRIFDVGISSKLSDIKLLASDAPMLVDKLEKHKKRKLLQPSEKEKAKMANVGGIKNGSQSGATTSYATVTKPTGVMSPPAPVNATNLVKSVLDAGWNAQSKRKSTLFGNKPEEKQSSQSEGLPPIVPPTVTLRSPGLSPDPFKKDCSLLQVLAMHQTRNIPSPGPHLLLEINVTKITPKKSQEGNNEKVEETPMESSEEKPSPEDSVSTSMEQENVEKDEDVAKEQGKDEESKDALEDIEPLPTMLQVFASLGGLAFIAQRLPVVTFDLGQAPPSGPSTLTAPSKPVVSQGTVIHTSQPMSSFPKGQPTFMPEWIMDDDEDLISYQDDSGGEFDDPDISMPSMLSNMKKGFTSQPSVLKDTPASLVGNVGHSCVPAHTMSALCLFLRLPYFSEEFLSDQKPARCLLRLMLGVLDDGQGEQIMKLELAKSLPMLPFSAIRSLLSRHSPQSEEGKAVRHAMTFDTTSFHLILACLSRFTHNEPSQDTKAGRILASLLPEPEPTPVSVAPPSYKGPIQPAPEPPVKGPDGKQGEKNYWAKGTGFGTGSTISDWDVENAVKKQKQDEGYITVLLEVLANFFCPESKSKDGESSDTGDEPPNCLELEGNFATVIPELLSASGLISAIASYLRNDSVLDMSHHVPLYCSLLRVIRSFAVCPTLCRLLMNSHVMKKQSQDGSSEQIMSDSILSLLTKMRKCIDTYASRLKAINTSLENQGEEGLTTFVTDVQRTESMLKSIAQDMRHKDSMKERERAQSSRHSSSDDPTVHIRLTTSSSLEQRYIEEMRALQFDTSDLVVEEYDGKLRFPSGHHFSSHIKETANISDAARARRLAQETVTLSNSLPLSHSSTVFVRCDEERLDVMKVLITGPSDTPYANGCFEFDVFFPADYNKSPPQVNLQTTGNHSVRFNPNLYNDGKVCLSILNTWHGRPEEKWNPQTSSFLQILVSIQSLILVSEPYFNEPGYERSRGTLAGKQSSREYDANIRQATTKWAMLEQLLNPSPCFKEIIQYHFWLKRAEILAQVDGWLAEMKQYSTDRHGRRTIAHNYTALQRHAAQLREVLAKMKCPEGLEDLEEEVKPDEKTEAKTEDEKS